MNKNQAGNFQVSPLPRVSAQLAITPQKKIGLNVLKPERPEINQKEGTVGQRKERDKGMEKKNRWGGGRKNKKKMADSKDAACHCAVCSSPSLPRERLKSEGSCRQHSERGLHRRFGGACMHKTDGKLFSVAAPIPGAGAGEGECVYVCGGGRPEVHEMGGSAT